MKLLHLSCTSFLCHKNKPRRVLRGWEAAPFLAERLARMSGLGVKKIRFGMSGLRMFGMYHNKEIAVLKDEKAYKKKSKEVIKDKLKKHMWKKKLAEKPIKMEISDCLAPFGAANTKVSEDWCFW